MMEAVRGGSTRKRSGNRRTQTRKSEPQASDPECLTVTKKDNQSKVLCPVTNDKCYWEAICEFVISAIEFFCCLDPCYFLILKLMAVAVWLYLWWEMLVDVARVMLGPLAALAVVLAVCWPQAIDVLLEALAPDKWPLTKCVARSFMNLLDRKLCGGQRQEPEYIS